MDKIRIWEQLYIADPESEVPFQTSLTWVCRGCAEPKPGHAADCPIDFLMRQPTATEVILIQLGPEAEVVFSDEELLAWVRANYHPRMKSLRVVRDPVLGEVKIFNHNTQVISWMNIRVVKRATRPEGG